MVNNHARSGIMWTMTEGSDQNWDHLARLIRDRRAELGLTQREVHNIGGPSPATLYQLESGHPGSYRAHILRRLERALGWAAGSVRRALAGGLPVLDGAGEINEINPPAAGQPDSHEWIAGFRKLPIDTRERLVILSSLLQETIADLDTGKQP
jgi:transcriptional regulator with XRE-family HTH domain